MLHSKCVENAKVLFNIQSTILFHSISLFLTLDSPLCIRPFLKQETERERERNVLRPNKSVDECLSQLDHHPKLPIHSKVRFLWQVDDIILTTNSLKISQVLSHVEHFIQSDWECDLWKWLQKLQYLLTVRKEMWWWSSGQDVRLQLWQSKFQSCWSQQFLEKWTNPGRLLFIFVLFNQKFTEKT